MELAKNEIALLEKISADAAQDAEFELSELQLAFAGGGIGDIVGA